jgi:hypothetical protein
MELEQRVEALELEVKTLENEIHRTLVEIQATLPEKPVNPARWQRKAWVLALLNMLVAVTLFTNIYLYIPGSAPFYIDPALAAWLRAFWIAVAFMWLLLQMYPLAMLLEQEDRQWQGIVWRNATGYLNAHPGLILGLTLAVLGVALVNSVFPALWFVVGLVLLIIVGAVAAQRLVELYREQAHTHARGG